MSVRKHSRKTRRKKSWIVRKQSIKRKIEKKRNTSNKLQKCNSNKNCSKKSRPEEEQRITVQKLKIPYRRYQDFHDNFLTYDKIVKFLEEICKEYPTTIEMILIGLSGAGKQIFMAQIRDETSSSSSPKMATLIEAGAKGDDMYAVSNAVFMIDYLTKNPNNIKLMDYLIIPCINPDAYDKCIQKKEEKNSNLKRTNSKNNNCKVDEKKRRIQKPNNKTQKPTCADKESFDNVTGNIKDADECDSILLGNAIKKPSVPQNKKPKADNKGNKSPAKKEPKCGTKKNNGKSGNKSAVENSTSRTDMKTNFRQDLSCNFPVVLGLNDMRSIPTNIFVEQIRNWKENYVNSSPEVRALLTAIHCFQFVIKMVISLQEGGQSICYPYGFCEGTTEDIEDLKEVAKKGKSAICGRDFEFGSAYHIKGLTYGNLIDFLKVDKAAIKYTYIMQVHKKTSCYSEKAEQKKLVTYGCQVLSCITRMSSAVYKSFCNHDNKYLETSNDAKKGLEKRSSI